MFTWSEFCRPDSGSCLSLTARLLSLSIFLCRLAVLRFNSIHAALARVELREYGCSADGVAELCVAAMGNADADVLG